MISFSMHRSTFVLTALAAIAALVLSGVYEMTHERIERNREARLASQLHELIPPSTHDNDLLRDSFIVSKSELGPKGSVRIWRAYKAGEPVATAMTVTAPDGYSGPIRLLVAIDYQGNLLGVRTLEHRETPGLGDDIEVERSPWTLAFDGRSLANTETGGWAVRRDGGIFDQFSGATVTPRAVVQAVHRALLYFKAEKERLFKRPEAR